jgi:hypothetical protein
VRAICAMLAVVLLVGCGGKPAPVNQAGNLYPLGAGYEWTYSGTEISYVDSVRAETTAGVTTTKLSCLGIERLPSGDSAWALLHHVEYHVKSERARAAGDTMMWYADTVYAKQTDSLVLYWRMRTSPRPDTELALPLSQGRTWNLMAGKAWTTRSTAVGQESVRVPAGDYPQAWRVEDSTRFADGRTRTGRFIRWFVPGVGLVRIETEARREDGTRWYMIDELVAAKTGK